MSWKETLQCLLLITVLSVIFVGGGLVIARWSKTSESPVTTQEPKVIKQPVYLMVRCPKGGGDVVFNITDDIALRQVYPN